MVRKGAVRDIARIAAEIEKRDERLAQPLVDGVEINEARRRISDFQRRAPEFAGWRTICR
jgi:hypothetical protein